MLTLGTDIMTNPSEKPFRSIICMLVLSLLSQLFAFGQSAVQNLKFTNISIKDGLSQSSPNCIFQDNRGLIWIGTEDGLNKYDGYSFTVYKPRLNDPNSISNSRILSIAEDHSGNLWIGTNGGGLNKYARKEDKFYNLMAGDDSLAGNIIYSVLPFGAHELWIGSDKGLELLNIETGIYSNVENEYTALQSLTGIPIYALLSDDQILWIGTAKGLYSFNTLDKSLQHYENLSENQPKKDEAITALLIDKHQNVIIGSQSGLSLLDQGTGNITHIRLPNHNNIEGNSVKALLEDREGNIWIATFGNGLFVGSVEAGLFENYLYDHLNPYSIRNNEVLSPFIDFSGLIWIGTNGIDIYNPLKEKFVLYDYVPY